MSIRICAHCGKPVQDDAAFCPHCGEELSEDVRLTRIPETIEELRAFCAAHKMPLDAMRFFIGEDFKGARAFGIFKREDGTCVVYKNKSDGSRAIRYEGPDEKHAVREIYDKLKSETELRDPNAGSRAPQSKSADDGAPEEPVEWWAAILGGIFLMWKPILVAIGIGILIYSAVSGPKKGYYRYQDSTYYYYDSGWYLYDAFSDDWGRSYNVPEELEEDSASYYDGRSYDAADVGRFGVTDFEDSGYYESTWDQIFDSDSSYDDYDWDSGDWDSWDSFDTDWDSDW